MVDKTKWTIATVNYKSSVYIRWQLRCLYEYNDPREFYFVILDNSCDENEFLKLLNITRKYKDKYQNIAVVRYSPKERTASGQHGEGLNFIVRNYVNSEYIVFQDPDFFWVKPDVLKWFERFFLEGKVAVGAPYEDKVGFGNRYFPALFGCAHRVSDIIKVDLAASMSRQEIDDSFLQFPISKGYAMSCDVGYRLRMELSDDEDYSNFVSFDLKDSWRISLLLGEYSFMTLVKEYLFKGEVVAFHLFRGTFTGEVKNGFLDPLNDIPKKWLEARDRYGEMCFGVLNSQAHIHISNIGIFVNFIVSILQVPRCFLRGVGWIMRRIYYRKAESDHKGFIEIQESSNKVKSAIRDIFMVQPCPNNMIMSNLKYFYWKVMFVVRKVKAKLRMQRS